MRIAFRVPLKNIRSNEEHNFILASALLLICVTPEVHVKCVVQLRGMFAPMTGEWFLSIPLGLLSQTDLFQITACVLCARPVTQEFGRLGADVAVLESHLIFRNRHRMIFLKLTSTIKERCWNGYCSSSSSALLQRNE